MNLADMANHIYSTYHSTGGARYGTTSEMREKLDTLSRDEFVADMLQEHQERWAPGGAEEARDLYAGSTTRATLSDTEIAVLANKYDIHNMDQEAFDAFLDDLQDMGAISEREKGALGYKGLTMAGYFGADGEFVCGAAGLSTSAVTAGGASPMIHWSDADGDTAKWISERVLWKAGGVTYPDNPSKNAAAERAAQKDNEMYQSLSGIISRIAALQPESGKKTEDGGGGSDIVSQFADAGGQLYRRLMEKLEEQARETEEDKREQAVIDAMSDTLDAMSGRDKDSKTPDTAVSVARISSLAQEYKPGDPRRVQLEQAVNQMMRMGVHLHMGGKTSGSGDEDSETLTQQLIREETQESNSGTSDLIAGPQKTVR